MEEETDGVGDGEQGGESGRASHRGYRRGMAMEARMTGYLLMQQLIWIYIYRRD